MAYYKAAMTDVLTKKQRSYNMSRIRSKNTKPEKMIFKFLKDNNYKFEIHYKTYGKPDIAFPRSKIAIFIDGEFWHGKEFAKWNKALSDFWIKKISQNIERDKTNRKLLRKEGWKILRVWGRDITRFPEKSYKKIIKFIKQNSQ